MDFSANLEQLRCFNQILKQDLYMLNYKNNYQRRWHKLLMYNLDKGFNTKREIF